MIDKAKLCKMVTPSTSSALEHQHILINSNHHPTVDIYNFPQSLYISNYRQLEDKHAHGSSHDPCQIEETAPLSSVSTIADEEICQSLSDVIGSYPNTFFDDLFHGQNEDALGNIEEQNLSLVDSLAGMTGDPQPAFDARAQWLSMDDVDKSIDLKSVFRNVEDIHTGPTLAKLNELKDDTSEATINIRHNRTMGNGHISAVSGGDYKGPKSSAIPTTPSKLLSLSSKSASIALPTINNTVKKLIPHVPETDINKVLASDLLRKNAIKAKNYPEKGKVPELAKLLAEPPLQSVSLDADSNTFEIRRNVTDVESFSYKIESEGCGGENRTEPTPFKHRKPNDSIDTNHECSNTNVDDSSDSNDDTDTISDCGSWASQELCLLPEQRLSRKKKNFWEYNIHGKKRLKSSVHMAAAAVEDPHVLPRYVDPVFSPQCLGGVRHDGKVRRGDGNDLTPNPVKLYKIGLQLQKLNADINTMHLTPIDEMPSSSKDISRKQKNKLASRACRLKKKAQHEANKVKLHGLDQEHEGLMHVLGEMRKEMKTAVNSGQHERSLIILLSNEIATNLGEMVAGNTSKYVNAAIQRVDKGDKTGGLHTESP